MTEQKRINDEAMEVVRTMKAARPVTEKERVFRAGMAFALGVPQSWHFDDETGVFFDPNEAPDEEESES